jgi:ketosteroid isomerase-like protein
MAEPTNLRLARSYLRALETDAAPEALRDFFTEDVVQREYPNRLVSDGATRDLAALVEGNRRGRTVLENQRYDVRSALVDADSVALEVSWSAVLKVPIGKLAAGDTMRAEFGVFLTFRDGRICSQRNYDCFEPF